LFSAEISLLPLIPLYVLSRIPPPSSSSLSLSPLLPVKPSTRAIDIDI
jgi:hypothetical protein